MLGALWLVLSAATIGVIVAVLMAMRAWERAVVAQMAGEIWREAEWRSDQRARALAQRMGIWARMPGVRRIIETEAARVVA
jgi:hypothetical protein